MKEIGFLKKKKKCGQTKVERISVIPSLPCLWSFLIYRKSMKQRLYNILSVNIEMALPVLFWGKGTWVLSYLHYLRFYITETVLKSDPRKKG